jgi:hypothetical protein
MEPIALPDHCDFQWSEYERIDWDNVVSGKKHHASSYMIRKGISRKAQFAYYTKLYISKNPQSILSQAIPSTYIIDTWSVWGNSNSTTIIPSSDGLAGVIHATTMTNPSDQITNIRQKLEHCLSDIKCVMAQTEQACQDNKTDAPIWILKGSTVNKGKSIYIVHIYEQIIDYCWTDSDVREW